MERISKAALPDIERWLDRVIEAKQLADVFNDS